MGRSADRFPGQNPEKCAASGPANLLSFLSFLSILDPPNFLDAAVSRL